MSEVLVQFGALPVGQCTKRDNGSARAEAAPFRGGKEERQKAKSGKRMEKRVVSMGCYDALTRMTNLVYKKWLTTLLSIDYRHDDGDRRTNEVWSTGRNLSYGYDRAHQLIDLMSTSRASDRAAYRYDKAGNPIRRTEMSFGVTNYFNNLNQIVSGIWTGGAITVAGAVNYAAGTVTVAGVTGTIYPDRTFDATNVTVTAGTNILTSIYHGPAFTNTQMIATDQVTVVVGNSSYTHDASGNMTGDENFSYQYDLANRLTNVILKASNTSVFAASYDGLGRRIEAVRNGTTTERYVYLPGSFLVLAILDGSNAVKEFYTHGPDLSGTVGGAGGIGGILDVKYPLQTNAPTYYLHGDAMGNIVLATDDRGYESCRLIYTAFARPIAFAGMFVPRMLFSSKEYDPETGLLNYGYRLLNPQHGCFINRDIIAESGGINLYGFVGNAPINAIDLLGLLTIGEKIFARFAIRAANSLSAIGRSLNRATQGPVRMRDDAKEMNPALDNQILANLGEHVNKSGRTGNIRISNIDLNQYLGGIFYLKDAANFKTGWWLNGAKKVIANGAVCAVRENGDIRIREAEVNLVWHDFIDANPNGENIVKHALETAFGYYDKFGFVSWKIEIPWIYSKKTD